MITVMDRKPIIMNVTEERFTNKTKVRDWALWKQRKVEYSTNEFGEFHVVSEAKQTNKQVVGSTSPIRHIVWGIALSGMFSSFADMFGAAFNTWSNNEAAVDLAEIDSKTTIETFEPGMEPSPGP